MSELPQPSLREIAALVDPGDWPVSFYLSLPRSPSRVTILRAIRRHDLAATFVGREYRILPSDFQAWMAHRRAPSAPVRRAESLNSPLRAWLDAALATAPSFTPAEAAVIARQIVQAGAAA